MDRWNLADAMSSSESDGENDDLNPEEENGEEKEEEEKDVPEQSKKTFADLGLVDVLTEACEKVGLST